MIIASALALSSIQEDDMKKFRDCMAKAIQKAPTKDVADELERILKKCEVEQAGDPKASALSGGHGPVVPPR